MTASKYQKWIREQPCAICYTDQNVVAHHQVGTKQRGTGYKESDYRTIPLCNLCHGALHQIGHLSWEQNHGVTQSELVANYLVLALHTGVLRYGN